MGDIIIKFWPVIIAIIFAIVWAIRFEGKHKVLSERVDVNECDIDDLKKANKEEIKDINGKLDSMNIKLTELCISFADLAGYMRRCREEEKHGN